MAREAAADGSGSHLFRVVMFIAIIAALNLAQAVLVPLALAVLLSFILAPLTSALEHRGLPRVPSVMLVAVFAFSVLGGIAFVVGSQVAELVRSLPQYRENIAERLVTIRGGEGVLERASEMFESIQREVEEEAEEAGVPRPEEDVDVDVRGDAGGDAGGDVRGERVRESPAMRAADRPAEGPAEAAGGPVGGPVVGPRVDAPVAGDGVGGLGGEGGDEGPAPVPVEIRTQPPTVWELLRDWAAPVFGPLATAGIVIVFVIFILVQRQDLRDRVLRLVGPSRLHLSTQALDEASGRISRYLLMQLLINTSYGVPVGVALWLIGVPGAALWGLLAIVLRFIPYIGPWLGALGPILLSFAVFEGWVWPLLVVGLFIGLELFSNNVMEPWLYGSSTGMSPVAVLMAAVFWSWLWGGVGLLLAVPLTASLVVLGKYVPQLRYITIMLGDEPALPPGARFYQRLLAMDEDEAEDLAEDHLEEEGLVATYDQVLIPALHLAERDRHYGRIDADRAAYVHHGVEVIADELGELALRRAAGRREAQREEAAEGGEGEGAVRGGVGGDGAVEDERSRAKHSGAAAAGAADAGERSAEAGVEKGAEEAGATGEHGAQPVLCLPARDRADELAARMLGYALRERGVAVEVVELGKLAAELIEMVREMNPPMVVVSAVPPGAVMRSRYLCKRLSKASPNLRVVVGLWNWSGQMARARSRLSTAGACNVITTLEEAVGRTSEAGE